MIPSEALPMTATRRAALVCLLLPLVGFASRADEPKTPASSAEISYYKQIRPILQQHCQGCHQPAKAQGSYIMTSHTALMKTGDSELPPVVPGQPDKSNLLKQLLPQNDKPAAMPRGKDPLPPVQTDLIAKWIAQGAKDDTPKAALQVFDDAHPPEYKLAPVITGLDYSPDGSLLAVGGYHEVLLHKADGSELVARLIGLSDRIQSVKFSPDGKLLAVAGGSPSRFGEVQIWDVEKKKLNLSVSVTHDTLYGISWSADNTKVAFGCADNTVRVIDIAEGKQILYQGAHTDWVLGTTFSADSSYVASVSRDMSLKLTEVATQRFIDNITSITPGALKGGLLTVSRRPQKTQKMAKVPPDAPNTAAKIYDELLIGGSDGVPRLYKMHREEKRVIGDDANKVREFEAMPGRIWASCWNADGSLFAVGSSLDSKGEVRVYKPEDSKRVAKFEGQQGAVYAVVFHPDGQQVASAGFDGVVRINDPQTGKLLKEFVPVPLKK